MSYANCPKTDHSNKIIRTLKVIKWFRQENNKIMWECICQNCNHVIYRTTYHINHNKRMFCPNCDESYERINYVESKLIDYTGKQFKNYTVLNKFKDKNKYKWKCKCICGNEFILTPTQIQYNKYISCGCIPKPRTIGNFKDLTNKRFNKLTVVDKSNYDNGYWYWNCKCDCGETTVVKGTLLLQGKVKDCGCSKPKQVINNLYRCCICKQYLPKNEFQLRNDRKRGLDYTCKNCRNMVISKNYRNRTKLKFGICKSTIYNHKYNKCNPLGTNKNTPNYIGVFIAENKFQEIFKDAIKMQYNNRYYDFVLPDNTTVDVKSSTIHTRKKDGYKHFTFRLFKNKITDLFACFAYDNVNDTNLLYIWIIPSSIIKNRVNLIIGENNFNTYTNYLYYSYEWSKNSI